MFKNMKIGMRLGLGFGLMIALMAILVFVGVTRVGALDTGIDLVVTDRMVKTRQANDVIDQVATTGLAMRNIFLHQDPSKVEMEFDRNREAGERITEILDSLDKTVKSSDGRKRMSQIEETRKDYAETRDAMLVFFKAGKIDTAKTMMMGPVRESYNQYLKAINELIQFQTEITVKEGEDAGQLATSTQQLLIILAIIALIIGLLAAVFITKTITGPISEAIQIAEKVAVGDTSVTILVDSTDETGILKQAMKKMVDTLNNLVTEMKTMSNQHDLGDIDVKVDATKFHGAFKDMGEGVNTMVFGHIAVKKKAMACIAEFGKGNFDAELEKFPGKKVFINNTIEGVRTNLKNVAKELIELIEASKAGQLTRRGNAKAYQGDWAAMIDGVNQILDAILMPIQEAAGVLDKVAARDMTARVVGDYKGDHAKIKISLNTAVDNLDKALSQVAEGATQVASASQQISAGSQALAQGANEQASSLEEVSSSLEEMASMTRQNADNAVQAKNLSGEADSNSKLGAEAMSRMSGAINRIKEGSDATAKIVKTIDEIAMQTNLLALNAAVEAARAGEAGRGFAVVAEEVRNLAQRSAQAAKNTADMIGESVKNADDGVKIAQEVSKSFDLIATSAKKVNDLIAEIAAASKEQSQGIEQVNVAVTQMDKVTQQNAANSEESASASEELNSQAEELQAMVSQFQLSIVTSSHSRAPSITHHVAQKAALPPPKAKKEAPRKPGRIAAEEVIPLDDDALKEF